MNNYRFIIYNKMVATIIWCAFVVCSTNAQTNREHLNAYIADVDAYQAAVTNIVKEGKFEEGISQLTVLIDKCSRQTNYDRPMLASFYRARGHGRLCTKEYSKAISDYKEAVSLLKQSEETGEKDLTDTWYQLSLAYYYSGKPIETINAADECIKTALDYYGPYHTKTLDAYSLRSNYAGFYQQKDVALQDRRQCFEIIKKNVERNFAYLTAAERSAYWNKNLPELTVMFAFAHKMNVTQDHYTDDLYNEQLLSKGVLLSTESSLQRAIDGDSQLSATYKKIQQLRRTAADDNTEQSDAEKATLEADKAERSLGQTAIALYQYLDFMKVNVADVRSRLKPNEVAIEFVDYRVGKDSTMYAALILSPQWEHVRFLPLIEADELNAHSNNLFKHIWQPILNTLGSNVKSIYFAPSGQLYQLPIESHPTEDGALMCETYNVYRVSSTRVLALSTPAPQGKNAVVYGGLAYDTSIEDLQKDALIYPTVRGVLRADLQLRGAVGSISYLPGTRTEAENVALTINEAAQNNLHAETLTAGKGTEASFKHLSGQFKRIVHIATHGFYQQRTGTEEKSIDNALTRCGLYFAGADNKYQGETLPDNIEDGILTAQEISSLDLRGLDLVVLSACETAKGDITGDGVFGLQRGFKKAGAQSIIMSLWKVDDSATSFLMTRFYKNLMNGKSKYDALEQAKKEVRAQAEKGWNAPKYWAAFILLDGLD